MSGSVCCCVIVEELDVDQCSIKRRLSLKDSRLSIVRNDCRQIVLRITPVNDSGPRRTILRSMGYPVKEVKLYKSFIHQGKATILLPLSSVRLLLSNCPPDRLRLFLATLRIKAKTAEISPSTAVHYFENPVTTLSFLEEVSPLRLPPLDGKQKALNEPTLSPVTSLGIPIQRKGLPEPNLVGTHQISTPIRKSKTDGKRLKHSFSHVVADWKGAECMDSGQKLQMDVIDLVKNGRNVFCTGGAGTGKSHLLKRIIGLLPPKYTAVTASTGTAANLIGGTTIHAFSGIGSLLGSDTIESAEQSNVWFDLLQTRLRSSPSVSLQWRTTRHLIIDEVSMISAEVFTRLAILAQEARFPRGSDSTVEQPFGGIQLIVFGDFYQLPPVTKKSVSRFAFESPFWRRCRFAAIELTHSYRQSEDPTLARLLSAIREGECPAWGLELLRSRCKFTAENSASPGGFQRALVPTRLCTHRNDADIWNERMLKSLPGEGKVCRARDSGPKSSRLLDSICPAPSILTLKVGAQVMLLRNIDTSCGLVNGARGVVESLNGDGGLPIVRFHVSRFERQTNKSEGVRYIVRPERWNVPEMDDTTGAYRRQLPLSLAWAISIHKSQGITLETAELALSKVFECGQAYVALSRCRTLDGLRLLDWRPAVIRADPKVKEFYAAIRKGRNNNCEV